ncbi:Hint domain-containing protein [Paracoccus sediminis]|uniref:Hint domain-containing protein n=2 Tax=Paracoccus sediminis TaxID=1214787 RepID=A0A238XK01_9RHOB|nr:Hint domain-containing protein [Paracoccus sediminis]SNR58911.1 Hint domain-containing protein [Paracoccus sediminis]
MDYQFTVLTLGQKITTKTTGAEADAPWSNVSGIIAMPQARVSTLTISDDDDRFQSGRYAPDLTGQTLTAPATFGNSATPTPAGTQMSFHIASVIHSAVPNPDGSRDTFLALFPRQQVPNAIGLELGGRFSVILIPQPKADGSYPVFDPARTYSYKQIQNLQRINDSTAYPPPPAVPCFAAGTTIVTAAGPRPVESLSPGDLIVTRDNGPQTLRWQGRTHVTRDGLDMRPNLRPILIRAGALGSGRPVSDLVVSPQHRVLVRSRIAHRLFQNAEILVAAKHLVGLPGIEITVPDDGVAYVHLLFDRHEIVLSNGAWSESLYTGPQALASVGDAARREILALFPELDCGALTEPRRRLLTGREARQLAERQLRNQGRRCLFERI